MAFSTRTPSRQRVPVLIRREEEVNVTVMAPRRTVLPSIFDDDSQVK